MKKFCLIGAILFVFAAELAAQTKPAISEIDRIRIAEVYRVGEKVQNAVWKDWDKAPFSMLLVTNENEFLIRHPKPSDEFQSIGYDAVLKSEIFVRPRKFSKSFLATFPAFGREPVIVIGQAENTEAKTSTAWLFTALHEHFHQLQYSQPTYYADVNALNLSRGDQTGMWQINFPFPYQKKEIAEKFRQLTDLLLTAYNASSRADREKTLSDYLTERQKFASSLEADDYRYASFQLWQEGIARYAQYKAAEIASRKMKPSAEFRQLKDFTPFEAERERILAMTFNEMKTLDLTRWQRTVFYPFGAIEGLLLDRVNPAWREKYFTEKFALEKFYPKKSRAEK